MGAGKPPRKTHEVVAARLRDQILRGEVRNGSRLPPEDELTVQLGIARTTLREALRVLESQGLLTIRRGRGGGPVVTHPSLEPAAMAFAMVLQLRKATIGDLDEVRQMIEPQIAGELARYHRDEDLEAISAAIDAAAEAADAADAEAFAAAAATVHSTLVDRSGNVALSSLSKMLDVMVDAYYAHAARRSDQRSMQRAVRSYRRLVELIRAGASDQAAAHWQAQMRYTIAGDDPATLLTLPSSAE